MPVITSPYDTAGQVLELCRSITNDAAQGLAGNILSSNQPYTYPMLNSCYRSLQEDLTNAGTETFAAETILLQVPPAYTVDPAVQVWINWQGCNDGQSSFQNPFLPPNMVGPLRLWERQTGVVTNFIPMYRCDDGLPSRSQRAQLGEWEWRQNYTLYFVGAMQQNDIRMRFNQYFPDLVNDDSEMMIWRGDRALAYLLAREYGAQRGSQLFQYMDAQYQKAFERLTTPVSRRKQRGSHRRSPYGSDQGWGWGIFGN